MNKEKRILYQRNYRKNNPLKVKNTKLKQYYGISLEEYNSIILKQNGLCAICKINKATHVDHCHNTFKVRGILCNECNVGLGFFKDNSQSLSEAINYLNQNDQ